MNLLQNRIVEISKKLKLSHVGSCLSALPVYQEIYKKMRPQDIFIADNAHSHLAHLVVKESMYPRIHAEELIEIDIHCNKTAGCDASGGSLGHGLGIGIGYALADPKRDVYVMVSEGSMCEGSSWEALETIDRLGIENIKIYTNFNGYSAVAEVDRDNLVRRMEAFLPGIEYRFTDNGIPECEGLQGHYRVLE